METDRLKNTLDDIQIIALKALNAVAVDGNPYEAETEILMKALADIEALTRNYNIK